MLLHVLAVTKAATHRHNDVTHARRAALLDVGAASMVLGAILGAVGRTVP